MSRRRINQRGRSKGEARHIRFYHYELNSAAFSSLTPIARALLMELKRRYNSFNNGQIHLSIRAAAASIGVAPNTARKGLDELLLKGFVKVAHIGSFNLKKPHATEWILTEYEYNGQRPTKDFLKLTKEEVEVIDKKRFEKRYQKLKPLVSIGDSITSL